jgi:hypothetical protein
MSDLRNHLFETLEALKDDDKPMDLNRARAVRDVAQAIVDSARVEVEFIKAMDGTIAPGEFFESEELGMERKPKLLRAGR